MTDLLSQFDADWAEMLALGALRVVPTEMLEVVRSIAWAAYAAGASYGFREASNHAVEAVSEIIVKLGALE